MRFLGCVLLIALLLPGASQSSPILAPTMRETRFFFEGGELHLKVCDYHLCAARIKISGKWISADQKKLSLVENPIINKVDLYVDTSTGRATGAEVVIPIEDYGEGRRSESVRISFRRGTFHSITDAEGLPW